MTKAERKQSPVGGIKKKNSVSNMKKTRTQNSSNKRRIRPQKWQMGKYLYPCEQREDFLGINVHGKYWYILITKQLKQQNKKLYDQNFPLKREVSLIVQHLKKILTAI